VKFAKFEKPKRRLSLLVLSFQNITNGAWFAVLRLNTGGRDTTTWPLPEGEGKMPRLALLDPTRTGRQAEDLENKLRHLVVGQDEAICQIVRTYQTHLAGLSPVGRPIGNFLFLGPTGSGKTRIVEATAETLVWRPALEARHRAPARTTVVKPDGQRPDSPRRLHPREPRGRVSFSHVRP
jgi:hypothetical protein